MRDDLKPGVLAHVEALARRLHCVAAVGISRDVFVDGLDTNLETGAAVAEHGAVKRVRGAGGGKENVG
jgi:hypothetical protein